MDTKKTRRFNTGYVFAPAENRNVPNPTIVGSTAIKPLVYILKDHLEITSLPKGYKYAECKQCQEPLYMYSYINRLYCSSTCRQKAYKTHKLGPLPATIHCRMCNKAVPANSKVARAQLYCGTKHRAKWFRLVRAGKPVPVFLDHKTIIYTRKYDKITEIKELYKVREKIKLIHRVSGKQTKQEFRRPDWYEPGVVLPRY